MAANKTIELIFSLNKHEVRAFKSYLRSEYFNVKEEAATLFDWILKCNPGEFSFQAILKDRLFSKRLSVTHLRYLLTDLNKHLENFIATKKLSSDSVLYNAVLLEALSTKSCDKSFAFIYRQQSNEKSANASALLQKFSAEEKRYVYFSSRQKRNVSLNYNKLLLHLDGFYAAKKLQLQCEILSAKNLLTENITSLLDQEIALLSETSHLSEMPAVKLYSLLLTMLTEPNKEGHFNEAISFINKHQKLFPVEEVKDIYQYIKNYCIKKINEGNAGYTRKLFELYNIILSNRRMMYHDYFSQWEFKNLVTISLRLNEKKWCNDFIKKYINYLVPSERVNAFNYNMAYWYWYEKKYHLSLKLLQKVEFTDVVYQLDSRAVILKIYYETDDYESLYYHLSAFRAFLRRNIAVAENLRVQYSNLIRYTSKIARHGLKESKLREIKKELMGEKKVADKGWLEMQVSLLGN